MKNIISYLRIFCLITILSIGIGCDNASKKTDDKAADDNTTQRQFISIGTAPIGGAFHPVGSAIADVVARNIKDKNWEITAEGTKGTQQNIRLLVSEERTIEFALANAAISYLLSVVRGHGKLNTRSVLS